ncbi:MAG TPA: peptide deformylase [bacterium]|nr:peptide deformylase [bacterium]
MADREIFCYGNPVLRRKAKEVKRLDRQLQRLIKTMFSTMYQAKGIGLAAPQIGLSQQIIVVDTQEGKNQKLALINPRITACSADDVDTKKEGCLSVPEIEGQVTRPCCIQLVGLTADGQEVQVEAEGLLARVIQHEIDHLNGILFVDRIQGMDREILEGPLKDLALKHGAGSGRK